MNCIQCGKETSIGTAYLLPFMLAGANGIPAQLVACSKECREEWLEARRAVKAIQDAAHPNKAEQEGAA